MPRWIVSRTATGQAARFWVFSGSRVVRLVLRQWRRRHRSAVRFASLGDCLITVAKGCREPRAPVSRTRITRSACVAAYRSVLIAGTFALGACSGGGGEPRESEPPPRSERPPTDGETPPTGGDGGRPPDEEGPPPFSGGGTPPAGE